MGCYDTIELKCPFCGKDVSSQTKVLGDCGLMTLGIGDKVDSDEYEGVFELKNKCECGQPLRILIHAGVITRSTKDEPNYIETNWGEVVKK